jgi:hypothetical protein
VSIPGDAGGSIQLASAGGGLPMSIGIPGDASAKATHVGDLVVYDRAVKDADVAVKADKEGGVQALVSVESRSAPTSFAFPISLPPGGNLKKNADGSISISQTVVLSDGTAAKLETGFIDASWATDAKGRSVKTWFEVNGNTVTQHIQHQNAAYPVVADPHITVNCGLFSCSVRFDRAWTRNARDVAWVASVGAVVCALITGPGAVACALAWGLQTVVIAVAAGRYYEDGDCLGVKKYHVAGVWFPFRVVRGTRNCA